MEKLKPSFYQRGALEVAQDLLGCILVHRSAGKTYQGKIVETEAYVGEHDLACHASKGKTSRTEIMYREGGCAYVYFIYGMHNMLNVVTGMVGQAQAVLVRALEPIAPVCLSTNGPGKLAKAFGITRELNGESLMGERLYILQGSSPLNVVQTTRIGVDFAKEWADVPLRFYDADSGWVSRR